LVELGVIHVWRTVAAMRGLVIGNRGDSDTGFVGERLIERGYELTTWTREDDTWPATSADGFDLVLVLGSAWSVYWERVSEPVAREAGVLRAAAEAGVPIFGICYGSQMLAHTFGGAVRRASAPEIGWYEIETDVPSDIPAGPWMQWHSDIVELPPGAMELARSPVGPQAWTLPGILALQFHPEVTVGMVTDWSSEGADELTEVGVSRDDLLARTATETVGSRTKAHGIVDWFLAATATVRT
jgi:GMP synthase-like glutamine amidotransferase